MATGCWLLTLTMMTLMVISAQGKGKKGKGM